MVDVLALFVVGAAFSAAMVIWGTLLQRRVPEGLRGRVSSLDFFVSLAFMPISMAIAGPAGAAFGLTAVFLVSGIAPVFLAAAAIVLPRLDRDELAHPLDRTRRPSGVSARIAPKGARSSVRRASDPPQGGLSACARSKEDPSD